MEWPGIWRFQPGQDAQQGTLAATVGSDQPGFFSSIDSEGNFFQHRESAVIFWEVVDCEHNKAYKIYDFNDEQIETFIKKSFKNFNNYEYYIEKCDVGYENQKKFNIHNNEYITELYESDFFIKHEHKGKISYSFNKDAVKKNSFISALNHLQKKQK